MSPPAPPAPPSRIPYAIPDAPVYQATLAEMDNLVELLASAETLANKYGAVRIDPPPEWTPPPLRMRRDSRFFVRSQTLPEAPFVDLTPPDDEDDEQQLRQTKRQKVEPEPEPEPEAEEVEEIQPVQKRVRASLGNRRRRRVVNYAEDDDSEPEKVEQVIDLDDNDHVIELDDTDDDPTPAHDDPDLVIVQPTPPAQPTPNPVPPADKEPPRDESRLLPTTGSKPPVPRETRRPAPPTEIRRPVPSTETRPPALPTKTRPPVPPTETRPPPPKTETRPPAPTTATRPPAPPTKSRLPPPTQYRPLVPTESDPKPAPPVSAVPRSQLLTTAPKRPILRSILPTPFPASAAVRPSTSPSLPTAVESLPPVPRSKPQQTGLMPKPTAGFTFTRRPPPTQEQRKGIFGMARGKQGPEVKTPGTTQAAASASSASALGPAPILALGRNSQSVVGASQPVPPASSHVGSSSTKPQGEGATRDVTMVPLEAAQPGPMSQPAQIPQTAAPTLPHGKTGKSATANPLTSIVPRFPSLPTGSGFQSQTPVAIEQVTPVANRPSGSEGSSAKPPVVQQAAFAENGIASTPGARRPQDATPRVNAVPPQIQVHLLGPAPSQDLPTRHEENVGPAPQVACTPVTHPSAGVMDQHIVAPEHCMLIAPTPAEPSALPPMGSGVLPFSKQQLDDLRAQHGVELRQRPAVGSDIAGQMVRSPTGLQSACLPVRSAVQQIQGGPMLYPGAASHSQLPHASGHAVHPMLQGPAQQQQFPVGLAGSGGQRPGVCPRGAVGGVKGANDVSGPATCNRGSLSAILNHDPPTAVSRGEREPSSQHENASQVLHLPMSAGNPDDSRPGLQAQGYAVKVDVGTRQAGAQHPVHVEHAAGTGDAPTTDVQPKASGTAQAQAGPKAPSQLSVEEVIAFAHESAQHATEQIQKLEDSKNRSAARSIAAVSRREHGMEGNVQVVKDGQVPLEPQSSGVISGQADDPISHCEPKPNGTSDKVLPSEDLQQGTAVSTVSTEMGMQAIAHAAVETPAPRPAQDAKEIRVAHDCSAEAGEVSKGRADGQGSDMLVQSTTAKKESQGVVVNNGIPAAQEAQSVNASKTAPSSTTGAAQETNCPKPETVDQMQPALVEQVPDASGQAQTPDTRSRGKPVGPTVKMPRTTKRPNKRKRSHVSNMKWDQDASGRLTGAPSFQDSSNPVSLDAYEKKAIAFSERMRNTLLQDSRVNADVLSIIAQNGDDDWLRNPDVLEGMFWEILHKGVAGKAITVNYGVDVEAEGAYKGQSYVEWYGMDKTGRMVKQEQKPMQADPDNAAPKAKVQEGHVKTFAGKMGGRSIGPATLSAGAGLHPETGKVAGAASDVRTDKDGRIEAAKRRKRKKPALKAEPPGPRCHVGNLNRSGLLRHVPRMPGVNHSMFYIGTLFTRFCWHTEDAFLNSVSYLHHGSADKIWYAVPPDFAPAFEDFAAKQVFASRMAKDAASAQMALMTKTTIFDPREVRRSGIEVYRIRHKPGSFVLTAPRAYHAGFNCGFNIAEAVNFANPSWFPVGREAAGFARRGAYTLIVPYEYLLFHEAKALRNAFPASRRPQDASPRVVSNARILARELDTVVQEGEWRIREYATASNCRIAMLSEVDSLVKNNQLGPEFGPGAGMVCTMCKHACHFYAEICGSCPDNREARCVAHFGQGFRSVGQLCGAAGHKRVLVRRHDPVLLADILTRLEEIAGIASDSERILSRYRGFLRQWETPLKSSGLRLKLNLKLAASRAPPAVQKDKRKTNRNVKRADPSQQKELDDDPDFVQKKKRRKSDMTRRSEGPKRKEASRKVNRGKKVESPVPAVGDFEVQVEVATQSELIQAVDPTVGSHGRTGREFLHSLGVDDDFLEVPMSK